MCELWWAWWRACWAPWMPRPRRRTGEMRMWVIDADGSRRPICLVRP
jgi:hypothetical protein